MVVLPILVIIHINGTQFCLKWFYLFILIRVDLSRDINKTVPSVRRLGI